MDSPLLLSHDMWSMPCSRHIGWLVEMGRMPTSMIYECSHHLTEFPSLQARSRGRATRVATLLACSEGPLHLTTLDHCVIKGVVVFELKKNMHTYNINIISFFKKLPKFLNIWSKLHEILLRKTQQYLMWLNVTDGWFMFRGNFFFWKNEALHLWTAPQSLKCSSGGWWAYKTNNFDQGLNPDSCLLLG